MDLLVMRLRSAGCVFAEDEAAALRAAAGSPEELETMAVRRIAGEPLEQVLGYAEFAGIRVRVAPGVFVPRLRSTLMVDLAAAVLEVRAQPAQPVVEERAQPAQPVVEVRAQRTEPADEVRPQPAQPVVEVRAQRASKPPIVLDLGCGTGAIGAAVASRVPGAEVWAVDIDPAAVACARLNLPADRVLEGDLFTPLPRGLQAQVICANAPYVPTAAIALMPPEARDHEHHVALDGGTDGLDIQRRLIAEAPRWLAPGGTLLVETSRQQADATAGLMQRSGLTATVHADDEIDGTVVSGRAGSGFEARR